MQTQGIMYPPQYSWYGADQPSQFLPPIIKNVNIATNGPTDNHQTLALIYEDSLPQNQFNTTFVSIGERLNIYGFLRSSLFNNRDGSDISLEGNSSNSLLSYLKFSDLNPYNSYKFSKNPYKGLPDGFLIYRTCYPIRYDNTISAAMCAKDSTGVNVRIYKMTEGSFKVGTSEKEKYIEYDEWREVAFYEFIRESILKKKICQNFPFLYGYYISENLPIDYDKINKIKSHKEVEEEPLFIDMNVKDEQVNTNIRKDETGREPITYEQYNKIFTEEPNYVTGRTAKEIKQLQDADDSKTEIVLEKNDKNYKGKGLVLLTESGTYNIGAWASKTYQIRGLNVKEMVNRGTHTTNEWRNILFQIMAGLYTLQINKMFIENFKLENNIIIKDVPIRGQVTNYWKYKINGIDYYIPNVGFIVLIDSNFNDIDGTTSESTFVKSSNTKKINGKLFDDKLSDDVITNKCIDMLKNSIDKNNFGDEFTNLGGCQPTEDIMALLGRIMTNITSGEKNIGNCIMNNMTDFMNNRIGTYLKEIEQKQIRKTDSTQFTKGQIVVYEEGHIYKFVLFLETNEGKSKILTKHEGSEDIIEESVHVTSLFNYSKTEIIEQTSKPNQPKLNEEQLLETYIIN